MGLDTTHDCWYGAYSAFYRWRVIVARMVLGIQLTEMEGFEKGIFAQGLKEAGLLMDPLPWSPYDGRPIVILLNHSDCDGEILTGDCLAIAEELKAIMPLAKKLPPGWGHMPDFAKATQRWIDGLEEAAERGENVEFR